LYLVNHLNQFGPSVLTGAATGAPYLDVNGDNAVTAADVLRVITVVNTGFTNPSPAGEGEASLPAAETQAADLSSVSVVNPTTAAASQPLVRTPSADSVESVVRGTAAADLALQSLDEEDLLSDLLADTEAARNEEAADAFFRELG
jgi:hypothetical protein